MVERFEKKKIVVAHLQEISLFPPVINLVENLLQNGHFVYLVSYGVKKLPKKILQAPNLKYSDFQWVEANGMLSKIRRRVQRIRDGKREIRRYMAEADILWTTTDETVIFLNKELCKYKHVMQLMELMEECPKYQKLSFIKFPIHEYARKAWKVVVPEINRAYIQKTWWGLKKVPYVLPNKPYHLETEDIPADIKAALSEMQEEKRKIILYIGVFGHDRDLKPFIQALKDLGEDYCIYLLGRIASAKEKDKLEGYLRKYEFVKYLGFFPAPRHLAFLRYAHIGLLPYISSGKAKRQSVLNAIYCAPNKIFEYAGFGVPMIGTDVPGLRQPFEQYNIGVCCRELSSDAIVEAIHKVEEHHDEMRVNCRKFYDSVDLDKIVDILYEEV